MNIVGYVRSETRTFSERPFSEVDSLVLSQLSYCDIRGIVPQLGEKSIPVPIASLLRVRSYENTVGRKEDVRENKNLLFALTSSRRFREIKLCHCVRELSEVEEKQFCALTFILPDGTQYLAFRGTDDTIVGWKEDFNLTFKLVPSQIRALEYLIACSKETDAPLRLGGHSKGGNLAVFAALSAEEKIQDRILAVYDHDGPGFRAGIVGSDGYKRIEAKIHKTVPESSVVGMLLESGKSYTVVQSAGFMSAQHNPLLWQINPKTGGFIIKERVTDSAKYVNGALRDWLSDISDEDRQRFIDLMFGLFSSGGEKTLLGLRRNFMSSAKAVIAAAESADDETKRFVRLTVGSLVFLLLRGKKRRKKELPE